MAQVMMDHNGVRLFWHQVGTKSRGKVPCGTALQIPPFLLFARGSRLELMS